MIEALLNNELAIRLSFFFGILAAMMLWEVVAPRRMRAFSRLRRWPSNLGIVVLNAVLLKLIFPITAVALAAAGEAKGWGLLNAFAMPYWAKFLLAILILDFAIYLQHVMFHAVPALWRLHRMHHADLDFDVTTGARFHPVEILLSMGIKFMVVTALGAPAAAVLLFEILLNGMAMFNHGNVRIPRAMDRVMRWLVVTPDMHRVHHSILVRETNSNFGFNLPWWDRLFGTYRDQPQAGHDGMTIGIEQFRDGRDLWLDRMLAQPLRGPASGYPIGREKEGG